jgi:hypothetical protein
VWRRPRPCDSHAHNSYQPDESYEPCAANDSRESNEPDKSYEPWPAYDFCDLNGDSYDPNKSRDPSESCDLNEPGGSGWRVLTPARPESETADN